MRLSRLAFLLLLLLPLAACQVQGAAEPGATVEFRMVMQPGDDPAAYPDELPYRDERLRLGPARRFGLLRAHTADTASGSPEHANVLIELLEDDAEAFEAWTGANVQRRMAWVHHGEVVTAPIIMSPLRGWAVLSGGAAEFSLAEAEQIAAQLRCRD